MGFGRQLMEAIYWIFEGQPPSWGRSSAGEDEGQGGKVVNYAQQSLLEGECGSDPRGPGGAE